jgi:hypothetical protein
MLARERSGVLLCVASVRTETNELDSRLFGVTASTCEVPAAAPLPSTAASRLAGPCSHNRPARTCPRCRTELPPSAKFKQATF